MIVLGGDIGGTNLRLALARVGCDGELEVLKEASVRVAAYASAHEPICAFLADAVDRPQVACLGVAGTVAERQVTGVNMPWPLDAEKLEDAADLGRVELLNDFQAAARGLARVPAEDLVPLGGTRGERSGPVALIGAGTGLGQAVLVPDGRGQWIVVPTEGGHRDFAPTTARQDRLLVYLRTQFERVSTERVLSGPGLESIYRFLVEHEGLPACEQVEAPAPSDVPERVATHGVKTECAVCSAAVDTFVRVYGAEAGNLALSVLASRVYVVGNIATGLFAHAAQRAAFRRAFEAKGRFSQWLSHVPADVVASDRLGLLGALSEAARLGQGA